MLLGVNVRAVTVPTQTEQEMVVKSQTAFVLAHTWRVRPEPPDACANQRVIIQGRGIAPPAHRTARPAAMATGEEERFRYTAAPERREKLVQYIADQGYCTIAALSEVLGVSEMTIRRDVLRLV